jgi:large subunit ribosomal protein L22
MIITATQKYTRQTARKVRYVTDVVKKMSVEDALKQLAVMERRASLVVLKTLRQAIANAMNNHQLSLADLQIKNIVINEAPTLKRWRAVSRGRAHTILKRSCHIMVELETKSVEKKVKPVEKKVKPVEKTLNSNLATTEKKLSQKKTEKSIKKAVKKTTKKTTKKIIKKDKK